MIGLTYNLNDGTSWNDTYTRDGIVKAANLTCYFNGLKHCPVLSEVSQGLAHYYGETPSISTRAFYDEISDIEKSRNNPGYFCRRTPGEYAYRFVEYNPIDQQRTYPFLTNRVIKASAGECSTYWETKPPQKAIDTSGFLSALNFTITNGTVKDNIIIPQQSGGLDATTYIYRGLRAPPEAPSKKVSCGDRCIWMWAHKNEGMGENSTFYQCPITISDVSNTNKSTQIVADDIAKFAASAIALQGRVAGPPTERIWTQYQFYPFA